MTTQPHGVRIAGVGSAVPSRVLSNADLEKLIDTSDEWILQRAGVRERRIINPEVESEFSLACDALKNALDDADIAPQDIDLIIHASTTSEMTCPPNACRIASELGVTPGGAFDLVAACSGFIYGMNVAEPLIRNGLYRNIAVVGGDALSTITDYTDRSIAILFGDAASAAILSADPDPERGCIHQSMGSDGDRWDVLYLPNRPQDVPKWDRENTNKFGTLRMQGREVFKFAVSKFREVIEEAMDVTGLTPDDVSQFICHQSNARIIEAAKAKLKLPDDKVRINIDRWGNTSAASVGLVLDELWKEGAIKRDDHIMLVAFGGGLTWASSVWKI
jgi:3-oxoacyl-[acyl-carrier-protein] synthase-3